MTSPHDRVALVTGAGSGIGRASVQLLVADGWRVVLSGRRVAALRDSIARCGDPFGDIRERAFAVPADVTRPDAVASLFDFVRARLGRLDFLFNNAGVFTPTMPLEDLPVALWRTALDTNATGAFLCTQQAFRMMKAQTPRGGRIVNNGSIALRSPRAHCAAYVASKHALTGLTQAAALDGQAHNIAVGQLDLGPVEFSAQGPDLAGADGTLRSEPRMALADVASTVLYLAKLPPQCNVVGLTLLPTQLALVGRG